MAKKSSGSRKSTKALAASPVMQRKSVDIKKANNGYYIVSQWTDKGEKSFIAKTPKEAQAFASKLLGVK